MLSDARSSSFPDGAASTRRLVAIVHADVVGYSRLIGIDDAGTCARLGRVRTGLIDPALERYGGRLVNVAGDALLMVFGSAAAAVSCALELQNRMPEFDEGRAAEERIRFRVGINVGDVLTQDADVHGDGVNVAARLQAACPPGGICVSRAVRDHVQGRLHLPFEALGALELKNIAHPVEAFVLRYEAGGVAGRPAVAARRRWIGRRSLAAGVMALAGIGAGLAVWNARGHGGALPPMLDAVPALSIAVLPFVNLSGDPEQAYLADGIAEDLTTDLSHLRGATVIARESAFSYKGKQVDVREVGRQLGARFVVEGSVRKLGDVVRLNAQLVSAETGAHVWAERFDKPVRELEGGLGDVVGRIGAALKVPVASAPAGVTPPTGNPAAFDFVLRARSVLNEPIGDVRNAIARGLFEQALRADPSSVPAMTGVAARIMAGSGSQLRRAARLVAAAEQAAPNSPDVLAAKFLLLRRTRRVTEAVAAFGRLLDTDSSAAGVAAQAGWCAVCWGAPEKAIPLLQRTLRLNPRSPNNAVIDIVLGRMLLLVGRDAEAVSSLERAAGVGADADPAMPPGQGVQDDARPLLAAAYARTDRPAEARKMIELSLDSRNNMDLTVRSFQRTTVSVGDPVQTAQEMRVVDGLRLAGLRDHLDESLDTKVPADGLLRDLDKLDEPTPMSVPGGRTIRTDEMMRLLADHPVVITTARANPTVPGAILMGVVEGGTTDDEWQGRLVRLVRAQTGGDLHRPIVTFASSLNHWHARNVALRLIAMGYEQVYWYRGGWEAWDAHDLPKAPLILQAWEGRNMADDGVP